MYHALMSRTQSGKPCGGNELSHLMSSEIPTDSRDSRGVNCASSARLELSPDHLCVVVRAVFYTALNRFQIGLTALRMPQRRAPHGPHHSAHLVVLRVQEGRR